MKTRLIIIAVIAALTMVSCTKYYRVLENDTPVYDELQFLILPLIHSDI